MGKRIAYTVRSDVHEVASGIIDNWGFYGFIAHTYPRGSNYASVLMLMWDGRLILTTQNNGEWTLKTFQ